MDTTLQSFGHSELNRVYRLLERYRKFICSAHIKSCAMVMYYTVLFILDGSDDSCVMDEIKLSSKLEKSENCTRIKTTRTS